MFTRLANWFKSSSIWAYGKKAVSSVNEWVRGWLHPEEPCPLDCVISQEKNEILNARKLRRQELEELAQEHLSQTGSPSTVQPEMPEFELVNIVKALEANALRKSAAAANTREDSAGSRGHQGGFEL